jgi:hypothetical protein
MKMKLKREIRVAFLAVIFITLTCGSGFAEMAVGSNYTLGGYIALGGGWLSDQPRQMNRGYLKEYLPFPQGFLAETDLSLQSKDGLEYYKFRMSHPGLRDQDFLLQLGKLGVYHAQIEYDQLQHLYCTVNPFNDEIGILLQRLRFSGWYSPTLTFTLFAENQFLRRTGWQPASNNGGPSNPYNFTTYLRPIDYKQNDLRVGAEYDQPTDKQSIFQGRVTYHLSTFDNAQGDVLGRTPPVGSTTFQTLPPSNMANYVTAEGALNLKSYMTRLTASFSYGWLRQNDNVFDANTSSPTATFQTLAGRGNGSAGLAATTLAADIAGVTRPIAPLSLRYSYRVYNFNNDNKNNSLLAKAFSDPANTSFLRPLEMYGYLRQSVNFGADYRVNNKLAFTAGYTWQGTDRSQNQGNTSSHSPQVGVRVAPTNWLSLMANYSYTARNASNFLTAEQEGEAGVPLTYKFYSGSLNRNTFNLIAEVEPVNNVTVSGNFSIYNDNFLNSTFGIQSDRGWSIGADVSWRPHDRVALSFGYDHQQLQTRQLAATNLIEGESGLVPGDIGSTLTTSDAYDTFVARADIKLIPKKLTLTTKASYSLASSNFHNDVMPKMNEYYADIKTFLTYQFNEHWACRAGYIFEAFHMTKEYQTLYLQGIQANGGTPFNNQQYNTLDGFFTNATAHVVQGFVQYKF